MTPESFLAEIESFLHRSGMSPTAFGKETVRDPNFVHDLRAGRVPSLRLAATVQEFIREKKRRRYD